MGNQTTTNASEDSPDDHVYMMLRTVQPKMESVFNFYLGFFRGTCISYPFAVG